MTITSDDLLQYMHTQFKVETVLHDTVLDYDEAAVKFLNLIVRYLPSKEELCESPSILDLGCNTGYNTSMLKEKYGGRTIGVDLNPSLVKYAKTRGNDCYVGDMHNLSKMFAENSFDLIFAKDILEHSYDPTNVLSSLYSILKSKGYLIALIPLDGEGNPTASIRTKSGNITHAWKTNLTDLKNRLVLAKFNNTAITVYSIEQEIGIRRLFGDKIVVIVARKE